MDETSYRSMEHKEHILEVPDTYVGSIEPSSIPKIYTCLDDEDFTLIETDVNISIGLLNIIIEIFTNASDQVFRTRAVENVNQTKLVEITIDNGRFEVKNDGDGIPVVEKDGEWIPEMIFGKLLSSGNYDKNQKRTWGGRNGYGAKLANIFSVSFEVETIDYIRKLRFHQVWKNNMEDPEEKAEITKYTGKPYTKITFTPDYKRFEQDGLSDDMKYLLKKRVVDLAGCTPKDVTFKFNGEKVPIKDFFQYIKLYSKKVVYDKYPSWEIGVCESPDGTFKQVSLVNGICTTNGGKHVDYICNKITKSICSKVKGIKPIHVKNNMWLFINCFIVNPSFSSQTKEMLTTPFSKFGSSCELSEDFLKKIQKTDIIERAKLLKSFHDKSGLTKSDGKKTRKLKGIPKLDDANWAGGPKSKECTLILTEGDSAKGLAVAGLSVVGRDKYGVFPLKGKLLNVRDSKPDKIANCVEVQNIKKILGLSQTTKEVSELRYGKVMIFVDQDLDGDHIKGLLMNFFEAFWPSLLLDDFLITMYTPIVKVKKGKKVLHSFYNLQSYENWKNTTDTKGLTIKYYKGLGTSTREEGKEYFKDLKEIIYVWSEKSKNALDLAFNKKRANDRKKWLSCHDPSKLVNPENGRVTFDTFIDNGLIHFSNYDNIRSIPSMDGFKPSQRKVIHYMLKNNQVKEVKVAQITGLIASDTVYHHGEVSLEGTIVNLAQNFVGSNNINLLQPEGQFGTRLMGGKDHAQSRYIFTYLNPITKLIYKKEDNPLLTFLEEETHLIEPKWFMPVIPMLLVNGTKGIGTGFSTDIPQFNPKDIIDNLYRLMEGKKVKELKPYYRGFKGDIKKVNGKWKSFGISKVTTYTEIKELPIGIWTNDYHEYLDGKYEYDKYNDHDDVNVHLKVKTTEELKLESSFCLTNMHVYDWLGNIVKFKEPEGILRSFYKVRLYFYEKRYEYELKFLERQLKYLSSKIRFVKEMIDEKIQITKKSDEDVLKVMKEFPPDPLQERIVIPKTPVSVFMEAMEGQVIRYNQFIPEEEEEKEEKDDKEITLEDYNYLLGMNIRSLTMKKVDELEKQFQKSKTDLDYLKSITPMDVWKEDLKAIEKVFELHH